MSESKQVSSTTLVIQPGGGSSSSTVTTSASFSSASSYSSSSSVSKSSSATATTTKSVKQTTTTSKTVKSSVTKSSTSTSSRKISINSSTSSFKDVFGKEYGINVDEEMKKLMSGMDQEVKSIREQFFKLTPLSITGNEPTQVVKLDSQSINDYVDKAHNDRLKFNFDVQEFESESISVKSDGNKIEVHAKKRVKKGDDETNEEYSKTYELPKSTDLNPEKVTSSFYKDGILTVELPVQEALDA